MKSTVGKKILTVILVPFFIAFSIMSAYVIYTLFQYVNSRTLLEIRGISEINAYDIEGRMYSVRVSVMSAANVLETIDPQSRNVRGKAEDILKAMFENKHIYNAWLTCEPNAFDGNDAEHPTDYPGAPSGRFMRSYVMRDGVIVTAPDMSETSIDNPEASPWYTIPRDTGELYIDTSNDITNLYDYGLGDAPVYTLSIVSPIKRDGRVIGCVGADVLFDEVSFGIGNDKNAEVAVFYPNGRIFYYKDVVYSEHSIDDLGFTDTAAIRDAIANGKSLYLPDEYSAFSGKRSFTYFQPMDVGNDDTNQLSLYVALPRSDAFNALMPVFLIIAVIMLVMFSNLPIIFLYISSKISKPIRVLTLAADAISQGDIETDIPSFTDSDDEIGVMSRSLYRMVEQLRIYILKLEQAQEELMMHSQITQIINQTDGIPQVFGNLLMLLCRRMRFFRGRAVHICTGRAGVVAWVSDGVATYTDSPDFFYHPQINNLLASKKLLFLNSAAITKHGLHFPGASSLCIVPLRTNDYLHGYIILESNEKDTAIGSGEELLLIYISDALAEWLSRRSTQTEQQ